MNILMNRMEKIVTVFFDGGRISIRTDSGRTFSRPLEAFPVLLDATPQQRAEYRIGQDGEDIRWEELDEDIHITSFFESSEPNPDNEIGNLFKRFPQLNVSEMARTIGINKSLLSKYIYGIKRPSAGRREQIYAAINKLGEDMVKACSK